MRGNSIIVSSNPQGKFDEAVASGSILPGTHLEIVPATADVNGRFTLRNVTRGNGAKGAIIIALEDDEQGKLVTDTYTTGTRMRVYSPIMGEELNLVLSESSGTGTVNETAIGDKLAVQMTSGQLMAGGALVSTPYTLLERVSLDTLVDTLHHVRYDGNNA